MKTLTQPHPENDNQADVTDVPKSILPSSTRGVNSIMANVNGRTDRRYYGPATQGFWKPPPDVEDALRRGNRKCRRVS